MAGSSDERFLLVFGSQTGQAKAISEIIRDKALEKGLKPELHCISLSGKKFDLEKEKVVVMVVSTTGDGEPPEAMRRFWRKLKQKTLESNHLSHCNYALLGLGDTNYDNFCNMGKMLNERLLELGAAPFHPSGYADDAVGLEIVVEPWIEGLWTALHVILGISIQGGDSPTNGITDDQQTEVNNPSMTEGNREKLKPSNDVMNDSANRTQTANSEPTTSTSVTRQSGPQETKDPSLSVGNRDNIDRENKVTVKSAAANSLLSSLESISLSKSSSEDIISFVRDLTNPSLDIAELKLPTIPAPFLTVQIFDSQTPIDFPFQKMPQGYKSTVSMATIVGSRPLTNTGSVKRTFELDVSLKECPEVTYEPGDALGFVCPNDSKEVKWLLGRLELSHCSQHHMTCTLLPSTSKRNQILPSHIPSPCTVDQFLTHCVNIRCIPKKAFLCLLSNYCTVVEQGRRLKELASKEGSQLYRKFFTEGRLDFLDILNFFPSCQPPLERLVEHLPRLQPRYYSAASSPLADPRKLKIAFNVECLPPRKWIENDFGTTRQGIATGWFASIAKHQLPPSPTMVPIFPRVQNPLRLPRIPSSPIVMIGPGTGVSPFIGFLNHLALQARDEKLEMWLFFGCRNPNLDYLYKKEIEEFVSSGVLTKLNVSYSQYPPEAMGSEQLSPHYVQDSMKHEWRDLGAWLMEGEAVVYVCGDTVNMSKNTQEALREVIAKYIKEKSSGANPMSTWPSSDVMTKLIEDNRFIVDAWA